MTGTELLLAASVDATIGDPRWLPHPVRGMGYVIAWCDSHVRKLCRSALSLRVAGAVLAIGLPVCVYALVCGLIEAADTACGWLGSLLSIGLASTTLAGRDLWDHVKVINGQLGRGNLSGAREAVGLIVGRDTEQLSQEEVIRATVETAAESTSDGVIAPLLYLALGGAPLGLAYKAVSTLDSMIGYRSERHIDFGWASARLDDAANWIPARLTSFLLLIATGVVTCNPVRVLTGWQVLRRDGGKHPSPNSGRPEAAMAGSLGVQLGGTNLYDGVPHERPVIGTAERPLVSGDIATASRIMVVTCLLGVVLAVGTVWLV